MKKGAVEPRQEIMGFDKNGVLRQVAYLRWTGRRLVWCMSGDCGGEFLAEQDVINQMKILEYVVMKDGQVII